MQQEAIINLFKSSFLEISEELVEAEFQESHNLDDKTRIAIIIGITGKKKGRIILETDMLTAQKFTEAMNCGDPLDDPKELYLYMAEFANMFCGRATTYINDLFQGREAWLAPPAIYSGKNLKMDTPSLNSEVMYFKHEIGIFTIDVGFEKEKKE